MKTKHCKLCQRTLVGQQMQDWGSKITAHKVRLGAKYCKLCQRTIVGQQMLDWGSKITAHKVRLGKMYKEGLH